MVWDLQAFRTGYLKLTDSAAERIASYQSTIKATEHLAACVDAGEADGFIERFFESDPSIMSLLNKREAQLKEEIEVNRAEMEALRRVRASVTKARNPEPGEPL